jgi:hypothetical protein
LKRFGTVWAHPKRREKHVYLLRLETGYTVLICHDLKFNWQSKKLAEKGAYFDIIARILSS